MDDPQTNAEAPPGDESGPSVLVRGGSAVFCFCFFEVELVSLFEFSLRLLIGGPERKWEMSGTVLGEKKTQLRIDGVPRCYIPLRLWQAEMNVRR